MNDNKYGELIGLDTLNAASETDCTGLFYRAPVTEDEEENLAEIYHYLPPESAVVKDTPPIKIKGERIIKKED